MKDDDGSTIHSDAQKLSKSKMRKEERPDEPSFWPGESGDKALARLILERTSDLVAITTFSVSPRYVYVSPSHKRILGYDAFDLLNKSPFDVIHPDDGQQLFPLLENYVISLSRENGPPSGLKLPTERLVYRIRDKSGNWHSLETTGDLLADDLILFISKDVTERVKAENAVLESRMVLQEKVEERTKELAVANAALHEELIHRQEKEEELQESERKYRNILESIEDGYYEVDLEGNMRFFNEALCRITGYSPKELHGMNNRDYTKPETAKKMFEIFNRIYRTGEPSKIDNFEVIKKDGTKAVMELSTSLMRNRAGEAIGFRGIARDVTERERIKSELRESEEKYRTILGNIEDGYYEVDSKGNFIFFNESMCKILGYSAEELKGMNNRQFMSEETSKRVFQTFNQVYRTGEPAKALGWELIRKDGERSYVETSVSLLKNSNGEPVGFRGIARDITERKRLEKAKERAINHLAHELGTPLSIIRGVLNRMPDELSKGNMERVHEWMERMKRNIKRLIDLQMKIDDIVSEKPVEEKERILNIIETAIAFLDELKDEPLREGGEAIRQSIIKRLESLHRVEESRKETILLDAFIDQVCQEARLSMQKRQLEIAQKGEKGIYVEMDPKVLKKVCEGFLKNAIENTPDEGKIEIELKVENYAARLDFRDFGVGITPENQKLIFSGFFHTQDTNQYASKKPYLFNAGGAGSDLLRARVLSERFGFSVDFSSTRCRHLPSDYDECPGSISSCPYLKGKEDCLTSGGSTFSLSLPLKKP